MTGDCLFCRMVAGDESAERVDEDELTFSIMDAFPSSNGHVLVIPKAHMETIHDLDQASGDAVWRATVRLANRIRAALEPAGLSLRQSNGRAAGQEIMHFHMHVVPRYGGGERGDRGRIAEFAERIRSA